MKRCKRLTKEQKEAVWAPPESNAGLGWSSKGHRPDEFNQDDVLSIAPNASTSIKRRKQC